MSKSAMKLTSYLYFVLLKVIWIIRNDELSDQINKSDCFIRILLIKYIRITKISLFITIEKKLSPKFSLYSYETIYV